MTVTMPAGLPPGVFERDGHFYRTIVIGGVDENGQYDEEQDREVFLATASDEKSIHQSREQAARLGLDFYDPRSIRNPQTGELVVIGWLDRGRKRYDDWPWNLGSGAVRSGRRYKNQPAASAAGAKGKGETNAPG